MALPFTRCVLVGLPGSGKTTVGARVAVEMDWSFVDVDAEIVQRTGLSIAELFAREGEAHFRALETRLTAELSSRTGIVIAPGGGWAARPGALESLPDATATVWLRVSEDEAIRRLRGSPDVRPLLAGADPLGALRALGRERNDAYRRADLVVAVDGRTAEDVSLTISAWLKRSTS